MIQNIQIIRLHIEISLLVNHILKVIPVENIEIFKRDFYLNYLKDVVLARFLDDSTFNLIASFDLFNHLEILQLY